MIKAVFLSIAVVFASLGICDFIHTIKTAFLFPKVKVNSYSVLFLKSGHAVSQLRFFAAKLRWYGSEYCDRIIALTDDLDDIEAASCERFCYGSGICLGRLNCICDKLNDFEVGVTDEGYERTGQ